MPALDHPAARRFLRDHALATAVLVPVAAALLVLGVAHRAGWCCAVGVLLVLTALVRVAAVRRYRQRLAGDVWVDARVVRERLRLVGRGADRVLDLDTDLRAFSVRSRSVAARLHPVRTPVRALRTGTLPRHRALLLTDVDGWCAAAPTRRPPTGPTATHGDRRLT